MQQKSPSGQENPQELPVTIDTTRLKLADTTYTSVVQWDHWLRTVGVHEQTGRRWRERGFITPSINILGRLYLTTDDIALFVRRARNGEFKKEVRCPPPPPRKRATGNSDGDCLGDAAPI
ncbi:MAG: hypothetical protein AB9869_00125 [Verrucomicrobiia bacterium]